MRATGHKWLIVGLLHLAGGSLCLAQEPPSVPVNYRRYFFHYHDSRSIDPKMLTSVGVDSDNFGRSFALIAGVFVLSKYRYATEGPVECRGGFEEIASVPSRLREF